MPKGYKHGYCYTPEYFTWQHIKARCHNKNSPRYPEWGGRGIRMCEQWLNNPAAFIEYMGKKPSPQHSIDRIDNSKGYEPGNCRWATPEEQSSNRKGFVREIEFNGITKNLSEWSRHFGINRELLKYRIDAGWSLSDAFTKPSRRNNAGSAGKSGTDRAHAMGQTS